MMSFAETIIAVEDRWLNLLYDHCRESFLGTHLPSHDHTHHLRVWQYARGMISSLWSNGRQLSEDEMESLIIAVFFHDLGMTRTHSREHGAVSRHLCEAFFFSHPELHPADLQSILNMVELHDDKDYIASSLLGTYAQLPAILNMADDLDAFGFVGVYRYAEIYHLRGIDVRDMPTAILPNLDKRFEHFRRFPGLPDELHEHHHARYLRTKNFFMALGSAFIAEEVETSWHLKVMGSMFAIADTPGRKVETLWMNPQNDSDPRIHDFFLDFSQEWLSGNEHAL